MIEPLTPVVELHSRLGRVGSIQAWNPWKSRESVAHAKWWVATVASLSYGNSEAKNPEKLFQSIVDRGHLSCLEFVPRNVEDEDGNLRALPAVSLRTFPESLDPSIGNWNPQIAEACSRRYPAHAFLVECPLYVRSQWMRHRSFSYLEMSRRYTKGSKVAWSYYGEGPFVADPSVPMPERSFHTACEAEYERRMESGWPQELARGCMPVEAMTKFWVAGFDRDWEAFCSLRSDEHAQHEIRVFSDYIRDHIRSKGAK